MFGLEFWDYMLVVGVSVIVLLVSYVYNPKLKAVVFTLPFPFTFATLSLGQNMDASNIAGMWEFCAFMFFIRWLHVKKGLHIILSIVIAAGLYCIVGLGVGYVIPKDEWLFWVTAVLSFIAGIILWLYLPHKEEEGHRSAMPIYFKMPLIVGITFMLVLVKELMRGAMTFFPMVGVFAAYEARKSLWTMGARVPILIITIIPLLATIRLLYEPIGLLAAMGVGWVVFGIMNLIINRIQPFVLDWKKNRGRLEENTVSGIID